MGYASCVRYIPNSAGYGLIATSANGIFFSNNRGDSWQQLTDDGNYYSFLFVDEQTIVVSGSEKISVFKVGIDKR